MNVFRNFGCFRYCILAHLRTLRKQQQDSRWAYRHSVFALVGQISWTWAGIENVVDAIIEWYHPIAGHQIQDTLPRSLDVKIEYLNKMLRDPGFNEDAHKGLRTAKLELRRLSKLRHKLMHGVLYHVSPSAGNWELQVRNFKGASSTIEKYSLTDQDLRDGLIQMSDFLNWLSPFGLKLIGRG